MEALIYEALVVSFLFVIPQSSSKIVQIIHLVNAVNFLGLPLSQKCLVEFPLFKPAFCIPIPYLDAN